MHAVPVAKWLAWSIDCMRDADRALERAKLSARFNNPTEALAEIRFAVDNIADAETQLLRVISSRR